MRFLLGEKYGHFRLPVRGLTVSHPVLAETRWGVRVVMHLKQQVT
jgi:hypothetical protein